MVIWIILSNFRSLLDSEISMPANQFANFLIGRIVPTRMANASPTGTRSTGR